MNGQVDPAGPARELTPEQAKAYRITDNKTGELATWDLELLRAIHDTTGVPVLLLDVDLTRAFRPILAGQIDDPMTIRTFHFTPSVAMKLINILEAGVITGTVVDESTTALADVIVTAYDDDAEEIASVGTDASSGYTLIGLPTGVNRLELSLSNFEDANVPDVAVTARETTDVGVIVMTAVTP